MQWTCAILSSFTSLALQKLSKLSEKQNDFMEIVIERKCFLWFSLQFSSETFLIIRRIQGDIIANIGLRVKHIYWNNFFCQILEKYSNVKFYENPPSGGGGGTELLHTDGQIHNEADSSFSQFYKRVSKLGATRTEMCSTNTENVLLPHTQQTFAFPFLSEIPETKCLSNGEEYKINLVFCWPCVLIYRYNKNQQDAIFTFNLFQ